MSSSYSALPAVLVDGEPLSVAAEPQLSSVEVDSRAGLPTMVAIALRDPHRCVLADAGITIGAEVAIQAGRVGVTERETLATVEVVAIEVAYSDESSEVVVRGYDSSHRLLRGRRTRSYHDVTDGDVVRTVAELAGLECGDIDDPGVVRRHVAQLGSSDWDFLSERARVCGRSIRVRQGRLELVAPPQADEAPEPGSLADHEPRQLVLGANVESFSARVSASEMPSEVEARAWSPESKQPLVSTVSTAAPGLDLGLALDDLVEGQGPAVLVSARRPVDTQEEVDALAASIANAAGVAYATATAVCRGDPELLAGVTVSIGLAGEVFTGRWTIAAARHTFDRRGYRTRLHLGGTSERTLLSELSAARSPRDGETTRGVVPGLVTDIADADGLARVRVSFPWLSEDYVSDWIRVVQAGAGHARGSVFLPEVDDEVLVAFEHGDARRPYVLGGLYNGQDVPPLDGGAVDSASGTSQKRGLASRTDQQVVLDDGDDAPGITLATSNGVTISLNDKTSEVTISTDGDVAVRGSAISLSGRSVEIAGDNEVAITAPRIRVEADSTLALGAQLVQIN